MPKKILVTEDSPTILSILEDALKSEGYNIITATDGQEALAKAQKENPDLIILDVMLPKMDGHKVCGLLKKDSRYSKIPIIMFTAKMEDSDREISKELGADAYLTKPFDPEVLFSKISELL
jgi:two-component system, OmpR family, alkaline phosphatase synthesis response regulator PhoP